MTQARPEDVAAMRVAVMGTCGAGKSTFAASLAGCPIEAGSLLPEPAMAACVGAGCVFWLS